MAPPPSKVARIFYIVIGILALAIVLQRALAGAFVAALWPALIAGFCAWRLSTSDEA